MDFKILYCLVLLLLSVAITKALLRADESVMYHQELDQQSNHEPKRMIGDRRSPSYNSFLEYKKANTKSEEVNNVQKNFLLNVIESLLVTEKSGIDGKNGEDPVEKDRKFSTDVHLEYNNEASSIQAESSYSLYAGLGYNILEGNPDGSFESGKIDPGIKNERCIFDLFPTVNLINYSSVKRPKQVTVKEFVPCEASNKTSVFNGLKSYQTKLGSSISISDQFRILESGYEFTVDNDFTAMRNAVFIDEEKTCRCICAELDNKTIKISEDFYNAVKSLPMTIQSDNNKGAYIQFITDWGTHYIQKADLGTKKIVRNITSYEQVISFLNSKNPNNVFLGGSYRGRTGNVTTTTEILSENLDGITLGSTLKILNISSEQGLYPIGLQLNSITELFSQNESWGNVLDSTNVNLSQIGHNLNEILRTYPDIRGVSIPVQDPIIEVPLPWPQDKYALIKPANHSCPRGWQNGSRYQDTINNNTWHQNISKYIHGRFEDSNVTLYYCVKTGEDHIQLPWPRGTYCIARKGRCPPRFLSGYIHWDDKNDKNGRNRNSVHGILPDGIYNRDTRIYYCCRCDNGINRPINLPIDNPFVLFSYTGSCQKVRGMVSREIWLQFADERGDHCRGVHPYDPSCTTDHYLKFCYYTQVNSIF